LIREAKPSDLGQIFAIERDNFDRPWSEVSFLNEFKKGESDFLVYETDGQVAGYIIFWYILDEAELANVAVDKKYRRKGIAARLFNHCLNKHPEVSSIYLEVDKTNTGAICLYERLGFKETGYIKDYYGKDKDALRMSLNL